MTVLLVVLAALPLAACSGGTARNPFMGQEEASGSVLRISAQNNYFSRVSLYAVATGRRVRLGTVGTLSEEQFSISWTSQAELQIRIETTDGYGYLTSAILASPGDTVYLVVESDLRFSRLRL
jgi:hypothetical protein